MLYRVVMDSSDLFTRYRLRSSLLSSLFIVSLSLPHLSFLPLFILYTLKHTPSPFPQTHLTPPLPPPSHRHTLPYLPPPHTHTPYPPSLPLPTHTHTGPPLRDEVSCSAFSTWSRQQSLFVRTAIVENERMRCVRMSICVCVCVCVSISSFLFDRAPCS